MLIEDAKSNFSAAAASGRVAHAYLIVGNPRAEAADFAVFAMQRLACRAPSPPCGECQPCRQIAARTFIDSLWLKPQKVSRIISVDQMRHGGSDNRMPPPYFIPWLNETSLLGGWKFGVISFADRMNESAANALLKTLEEPPPETLLLLLTSNPQSLLPTIISRCETIELYSAPPELDERHAAAFMGLLSSFSRSGPVAANALAQDILAILSEMHDGAEAEIREEIRGEDGLEADADDVKARVSALYREKRSLLVLTLQRWFRDMLAVKAGGPDAPIHYSAFRDDIVRRARRLTLAQALSNVDAAESLSTQLNERNMADSVAFPYWLDRMDFGGGDR